ncbi:MAG: UPF0236 family protein [Eubacteriales bacterium]|nr:UPF0236 family protein [Eubacteriales bacterium]
MLCLIKTMATAYDGWVTEDKNRYVLRNKVMVCGFDDTKEFQRKKEGAIAAVFATDEITMRIPNGDGGAWIKSGIADLDTHFQLDPFHKNREITRKVKDKEQRETIRKLLSEKRIKDNIFFERKNAKSIDDPKRTKIKNKCKRNIES